jgi:hypothetical protein
LVEEEDGLRDVKSRVQTLIERCRSDEELFQSIRECQRFVDRLERTDLGIAEARVKSLEQVVEGHSETVLGRVEILRETLEYKRGVFRPNGVNFEARLRKVLEDCFSDQELRTFCQDLGVSYDRLEGVGLSGKARELVAYMGRRNHLCQLIKVGKQQRPDIPWDSL